MTRFVVAALAAAWLSPCLATAQPAQAGGAGEVGARELGVAVISAAVVQDELTARLAALEAQVETLREQVAELRAQRERFLELMHFQPAMVRAHVFRAEPPYYGLEEQMQAVAAAVAQVRLPDNPSDDDVRAYVRKLLRISQGQGFFLLDDPQIAALAALGSERLPLILDVAAEFYDGSDRLGFISPVEIHLSHAVGRLAGEEHRGLLAERLRSFPPLGDLIAEHGWEEDVRALVLESFMIRPVDLPRSWYPLVARYDDPATHAGFRHAVRNSLRPDLAYAAASRVTGLDLDEIVADVWTRAMGERERWGSQYAFFATIAARHGHADALEPLLERAEISRSPAMVNQELNALQELTGQYVDIDELRAWLHAHRDRLEFNRAERLYVVRE